MPKSKLQKKKVLDNASLKLNESKSFIVSVFEKLPVKEDFALRKELKSQGAKHEIIKKTLLKKVLAEKQINHLDGVDLIGNLAITTSDDEVMGAKILAKFIKGKENFKIVGGVLNNQWLEAEKIMALAKLPSKEELIAKTVWTIKAPLTGFVNVLSGNMRGLVNVLNSIKDKKN